MENYSKTKKEEIGKIEEPCPKCGGDLIIRPYKVGAEIYPKIEDPFCFDCDSYFSIKNGAVTQIRKGIQFKKNGKREE